ncbi:CidA/LrgA family protein [Salinarimonas ramus]|uniref:Holin-like protein n=1 Tax=Salinarimonas ramus TaxID=690164 RepID=A0A917V4M5_9HYPH|nr:CidA/LrgA family protein [Salinarimonas ramus]GGK37011.1 hypothetical protein GCM10011322_25040 [Salinarimonas ramus]
MLGFIVIIAFTLAGEALVALAGLPVPGSIVGLLLLCGYLTFGRAGLAEIDATARLILRFLPLFLVPVGVAVVGLGADPGPELARLVATLVVALVVGVLAVSSVMRLVARRS